jgi:hypothetical protein
MMIDGMVIDGPPFSSEPPSNLNTTFNKGSSDIATTNSRTPSGSTTSSRTPSPTRSRTPSGITPSSTTAGPSNALQPIGQTRYNVVPPVGQAPNRGLQLPSIATLLVPSAADESLELPPIVNQNIQTPIVNQNIQTPIVNQTTQTPTALNTYVPIAPNGPVPNAIPVDPSPPVFSAYNLSAQDS